MCPFAGTLAPPFGGEAGGDEAGRFPGLPSWLDLDIIVPVVATVIVVCVGVLVVCVAITRRKRPMIPPGPHFCAAMRHSALELNIANFAFFAFLH